MNLQKYAHLYSNFHGAYSYEIKNGIICIPLLVYNNIKNATLKLTSLNELWSECDRPLMQSIKCYFKQQIPLSVFYKNNDWCVLLGNEKMCFPQSKGTDFLCATQYFVHRDVIPGFHKFMLSIGGILSHSHIYYFHNMVLFLDDYDIIFPGGNYLSTQNEANEWFRINFIGNELDAIQHLSTEKTIITEIPHKSKAIDTNISKFLTLTPKKISQFAMKISQNLSKKLALSSEEFWLPEHHYKSTNIVRKDKCYDNPAYILQDILKSFPNYQSLGIILEYPILISYEYNNTEGNHTYVGFAINSTLPKNIAFVPYPYERYHYYENTTIDISWQYIFFDPTEKSIDKFAPVIFDNVILGYVYKNAFFCLPNIKLNRSLYPDYKNTENLFSKSSIDITADKDFVLLHTFVIDNEYALCSYKHKLIEEELWCMCKKNDFTANTIKKNLIPDLVQRWASVVLDIDEVELHACCIKYLKIMYTFVKHGICFEMIKVNNHEEEYVDFDQSKTIIFYVCESLIKYVNTFRLLIFSNDIENADTNCTIL